MDIQMAGIDHSKAGVETRELFAFTKGGARAAMEEIKNREAALGCVVLSTCNRTELWLSGGRAGAYETLCSLSALRRIDRERYRGLFAIRSGEEAVSHLLRTACGMNSRLFGEDQIITQVGDAALLARECEGIDKVLETLFRTAVTYGKRVKTEIPLTKARRSAAQSAVDQLEERFVDWTDVRVLVIGNGGMGTLTAELLKEKGANVTMTLRQYKSGSARAPKGCLAVPYESRMEIMEGVDAVVSATASPHYTVHFSDVVHLARKPSIFIDLAVPRDIEPAVGDLSGVTLWDIDQMSGEGQAGPASSGVRKAEELLLEYAEEFNRWYAFQGAISPIREVSQLVGEELILRMGKRLQTLPDEIRKPFEEELLHHTQKMESALLFGLRDTLEPRFFDACTEALKQSAVKLLAKRGPMEGKGEENGKR